MVLDTISEIANWMNDGFRENTDWNTSPEEYIKKATHALLVKRGYEWLPESNCFKNLDGPTYTKVRTEVEGAYSKLRDHWITWGKITPKTLEGRTKEELK